jgi:hypothetical protein
MVDYNKIKNWTTSIIKNKNKLKLETDFTIKQKLKYKIGILDFKIKIERLN